MLDALEVPALDKACWAADVSKPPRPTGMLVGSSVAVLLLSMVSIILGATGWLPLLPGLNLAGLLLSLALSVWAAVVIFGTSARA